MPPAHQRVPRHVGIIPDGNRRWADARGLARGDGYAAGIAPGIVLLRLCRDLGIQEASVYGFTRENVRRPTAQVTAFQQSCVAFASAAIADGAALRAVGDTASRAFPDALRSYTAERSDGGIRVNLLVNYSWQWDLGVRSRRNRAGDGHWLATRRGAPGARGLGSWDIPRIDLVVRWGARRRLSGFLPLQSAYADLYVIDTLWPDMRPAEFHDALAWYAMQDVTLGG